LLRTSLVERTRENSKDQNKLTNEGEEQEQVFEYPDENGTDLLGMSRTSNRRLSCISRSVN
jgi:hypothetical protein